jgi:hypothetical protein
MARGVGAGVSASSPSEVLGRPLAEAVDIAEHSGIDFGGIVATADLLLDHGLLRDDR